MRDFLADAGDGRYGGDVTCGNVRDEVSGLEGGEGRDRHLGADAAHGDELLEELPLGGLGKSEERDIVFLDVQIRPDLGRVAAGGKHGECMDGHRKLVANAAGLDDGTLCILVGDDALDESDHATSPCRVRSSSCC